MILSTTEQKRLFQRLMDRFFLRAILIIGALVLASLFYRFTPDNDFSEGDFKLKKSKVGPAFLKSPEKWVDSVLNTLTPAERVAQMIMVAAYSNNNQMNELEVENLIRVNNIGGVCFFQGTPYRQAYLTNRFQAASKIPLLIGMDAEWGLAMRLDSTIRYPKQMMLGGIKDEHMIFDMGTQIARQLQRLGVHVNFAPVTDINNNPQNPVIDSRSFGEDRANVTRKSLLYMIGMQQQGIMAVAKHFPGHGDTDVDSHEALPSIRSGKKRLDSLELFPYRELISNGLSGVMTGHLQIPSMETQSNRPASLSRVMIDSLLRKEMGFKGLIFTDALNMKAIANNYKPEESAELAIRAGNDILLMPDNVPAVIQHILKLVENGDISQADIDTHCRRILAAKYYAGLNHYHPVDVQNIYADLNTPEYQLLQRQLTAQALTVLVNKNGAMPLRHLDTLKVASVILSPIHDTIFQQTLSQYLPVANFWIKGDGNDNLDSIYRELKKYNLVIAGIHSNSISSAAQYGINDRLIAVLDSMTWIRPVMLDVFANPYLLNRFKYVDRFRSVLVSYENSALVQNLSAQLICGGISTHGTLPVTASHFKALVPGLPVTANGRLAFSIPLEAGMNADTLKRIDAIIAEAIASQAMPGCQVLVARHGIVVMNKAYGNPMYKDSRPVLNTDLYDLASVTKVIATTQAVMRLSDEGCIDIKQKLSAYLPYLRTTDKKNMMIRDMLVHQAGLAPFIQFYFSSLEPVFEKQALISPRITDVNPIRIGANQYLNRYTRYKKSIVSTYYSDAYPLHVAENVYFVKSWNDTIYDGIAKSPLAQKKQYVYSDLGFILLKQLVDTVTHASFDEYLDSAFYRKLGADRLCFNPLRKFSKYSIAPTEDDQLFRKQLIRGYVHDPRAAMLGGISGHAGLFGDALDVAKVLQMMLNKGEYGGERLITPHTIAMFTEKPLVSGNRRGLGFDKPEPDKSKPQPVCKTGPSLLSYGHTGFTGNMIWVDPSSDMIYVFLSNRVYPDAENTKLAEMNVRTNVQQVLYNAIIKP
jgi:beta-N-acetylhexosaminidase